MTTLQELYEANSVVFETENGKTSALYIEEAIKCAKTWLEWWERDALEHVKWCQNKKMSTDAAMGRLHQIQEIRRGLTDKQFIDTPDASIRKQKKGEKP